MTHGRFRIGLSFLRTSTLGAAFLTAHLSICSGVSAQNSPPVTPVAPGSFKVAGTAVNSVTGSALAQARVALADTRSRRNVGTVVTSEDGYFEFASVPAGKYSLIGTKPGFLTQFYEQHEQFNT